MKNNCKIAQDKSLRSYDADGRLHLEKSNISKACVNQYMGSEIPGCEDLGLDPKKVYNLLRCPQELGKAASTFVNLPILIQHVPVSAEKPMPELVIGSTGSDAEFDGKYLNNSLSFWDGKAIALIEAEAQKELSSAYRYTPDMTPGEFEGVKYDGVMRDIVGNHVALVETGRAGSDVVVADSDPFFKGGSGMSGKLKQAFKTAIEKAKAENLLAQDADLDKIVDLLAAATGEVKDPIDDSGNDPAEPKVADSEGLMKFLSGKLSAEDMAAVQKLCAPSAANDSDDKDKDDNKAKDSEGPPITKAAMDAAIAEATKQARKAEGELHTAREGVKDLVGFVAMDSAEAVYRFALDKSGVKHSGVNSVDGLRSMVELVKSSAKNKPALSVAMDSELANETMAALPNLKKRLGG